MLGSSRIGSKWEACNRTRRLLRAFFLTSRTYSRWTSLSCRTYWCRLSNLLPISQASVVKEQELEDLAQVCRPYSLEAVDWLQVLSHSIQTQTMAKVATSSSNGGEIKIKEDFKATTRTRPHTRTRDKMSLQWWENNSWILRAIHLCQFQSLVPLKRRKVSRLRLPLIQTRVFRPFSISKWPSWLATCAKNISQNPSSTWVTNPFAKNAFLSNSKKE